MSDNIKGTSKLGVTTYHNIVTRETYDVPWGGVDWLGFVGFSLVVVAFISIVFGMAFVLWTGSPLW